MEQAIPTSQSPLQQIQMKHQEITEKFNELQFLLEIQFRIIEGASTQLIDPKQIEQTRKLIDSLSQKTESLRVGNLHKLIHQQQETNQQKQKQFALSQYQEKLNQRLYVLVDKQADIVYDHIGKKQQEKPYFQNLGLIDSATRQLEFIEKAIGQLNKERREMKKIRRVSEWEQSKGGEIEELAKQSTSTIQSGFHEGGQRSKLDNLGSVKEEINCSNQNGDIIQNPETAQLIKNQTNIYEIGLLYELIQQEEQKYVKLSKSYTCLREKHTMSCEQLRSLVGHYNASK